MIAAILNNETQIVCPRILFTAETGKPRPECVRGTCPECGDDLVSNSLYTNGKGYIISWECWSSLADHPTCSYREMI